MQSIAKNTRSLEKKQPFVLPVFFSSEMWERFGFYMIQGLLVLYMTSDVFHFSDNISYAILGAFVALCYITPVIGGYLASHFLDFEHAITLGGVLLTIGYALMALHHQTLFYVALAVISIGTGFFKPSISSYLGDFYLPNDPHRETGYIIFYIGINVGVLLSTSISGYLVRYFGWHIPFLIASIGLLFGTLIFVFGILYLKHRKKFHRIKPGIARSTPLSISLIYFGSILATGLVYVVILHQSVANPLMLYGGSALLVALSLYAFYQEKSVRNRMLACLFLIAVSIVFWAIYFQMFFSMSLFIERAVDRQFFHTLLPTPIFISLESIFLILLGPFFALFWKKLEKKKKNPGIPMKFSLALCIITLALLVVFWGAQHPKPDGQVSSLYMVFAYCLVTISELLLSPIGLMMITVLIPQQLVGMMMGVWFVALGLGVKLAGVIASKAAIPKTVHSPQEITQIYGSAFFHYAALGAACALLILLCVPLLNRLISTSPR